MIYLRHFAIFLGPVFSFFDRRNAIKKALVLLLLILVLLPSISLFAWSYHTHRKLCSDALNRLPPPLFARFSPYKKLMLQGSTDPDTLIKDFTSHVYHVNGQKQDAQRRFQELWKTLIGNFQAHNDEEAAYTMGLFSHYIADINQPLHTAGAEEDPYESDYHAAFEKEVQGQLSKIPIGEIHFQPVTDPLARLDEMARAAHNWYAAIGAAYRRGNRFFDVKTIVEHQLTAAVQNIVDFWLGALQAAGQDIGLASTTLISVAPMQTQYQNPNPTSHPTPTSHPSLSLSQSQNQQVYSLAPKTSPVQDAKGNVNRSSQTLALDINTATLEQLMEIPGIGEKRARAIIENRPFKTIYDLAKIERNGRKIFDIKLIERISDRIRAGP